MLRDSFISDRVNMIDDIFKLLHHHLFRSAEFGWGHLVSELIEARHHEVLMMSNPFKSRAKYL